MDGVAGGLVAILIAVVIFLICRAIVLWYWRVNEAVELLKSIDYKLGVIAANTADRDQVIDADTMRARPR